jgi:hypothetical protein
MMYTVWMYGTSVYQGLSFRDRSMLVKITQKHAGLSRAKLKISFRISYEFPL